MSVPEHTPAVEATPAPEQSEVSKAAMAAPETENTDASPHPEEATTTIVGGEPTTVPGKETTEEATKKDETVVEATPASEGVLGYKAPGIFKQFRYVKNYFWFSEEPLKSEHLAPYIRDEKVEVAHPNAAWAQETGKGVLFYAKRAEDKATPAGLIMLADVVDVAKEGTIAFQFKAGHHTHKMEAANSQERDSWIVAIEKSATEAKSMKESITGSEGYKKTLENYTKSPALVGPAAVAASKSTSRPAKKSLDATAATAAATPATNGTAKETDAAAEEESPKETKGKSRSQSRKRASIFGTLRGKKEDKDEQKELKKEEKADTKAEKAEEKAEKKQEKEEIKQEKKAEAVSKKEEAKEEHDSSKAKEAAEAAAVAAVPAAAVAAEKKHEDKTEEKKSEEKSGATTPTDKKAKRNSVFGSLFGKKNVTSPTAEKTEKEATPAVPAKDTEALPVAETAPQLEEPIENKPIDTAAVTAPVDTVTTPAAEEPTKEVAPAETTTAPKSEEKGGILGFIKKQEAKLTGKKEQKEEKKEEVAGETIAKDPVVAAAPTEAAAAPEATPATTEERPAREKRRTSLFGSLGTLKKKPATDSEETDASPTEKREKSPLPSKLTGLFRRPSKAVKPTEETPATTETTDAAKPEVMTNGETAETSAAVPESTESKMVGDVVPDELHTTVHDSVTTGPSEVKATA